MGLEKRHVCGLLVAMATSSSFSEQDCISVNFLGRMLAEGGGTRVVVRRRWCTSIEEGRCWVVWLLVGD